MKVGDTVQRSPKVWKDPKHQWIGTIVAVRYGASFGKGFSDGFLVDFKRTSISPWTGKREKDAPTFFTPQELVVLKPARSPKRG